MKPQAPLSAVVLASTGQNVRSCQACQQCDDLRCEGMELTFGDIMRATALDKPTVLSSPSLWCCEPLIRRPLHCQADIDVPAVIEVLRREAFRRGLAPALVGDQH
jgi:heterodisulfide reductase subunit C